jgi:hypothetical protein
MKDKLTKLRFIDSKKVLIYTLVTFIALVVVQVIGYFTFLNQIPNFLIKFGWWIFYLDVSIATIAGALWYYASYKGYVSCMASMMIGMTFGMQIGMMLGAVFGAVNGYFVGAMVGMILGSIVGVITGRSSIMGVLQGMMSGLMGGTMGGMITIMMYTDHVLYFMPFYMILNVAILIGFIYMYHDELIKDNNEVVKCKISVWTLVSLSVIIGVIFSIILIYGPKSILFG